MVTEPEPVPRFDALRLYPLASSSPRLHFPPLNSGGLSGGYSSSDMALAVERKKAHASQEVAASSPCSNRPRLGVGRKVPSTGPMTAAAAATTTTTTTTPPCPLRRPSPAPGRTSQFLPIASLLNPQKGLKRRRSEDDVDGPDTASLSSKKRRLARCLVTSRLSSPYSQPASHIHGRTDAKMLCAGRVASRAEAVMVAHRRLPHATSTTSFLRLCAMNRMRERLRDKLRAVAARRVDYRPPWPRDRPAQQMFLPSRATTTTITTTTTTTTATTTTQMPMLTTHLMPRRPAWAVLPTPWSRLAVIDRLISSEPPPTPIELPRPTRPRHGPDSQQSVRDAAKETEDVRCDFSVLFATTPSRALGSRDQRGGVAELPELPLVAR